MSDTGHTHAVHVRQDLNQHIRNRPHKEIEAPELFCRIPFLRVKSTRSKLDEEHLL